MQSHIPSSSLSCKKIHKTIYTVEQKIFRNLLHFMLSAIWKFCCVFFFRLYWIPFSSAIRLTIICIWFYFILFFFFRKARRWTIIVINKIVKWQSITEQLAERIHANKHWNIKRNKKKNKWLVVQGLTQIEYQHTKKKHHRLIKNRFFFFFKRKIEFMERGRPKKRDSKERRK